MLAASAPTPIPAVWANDASSPYINSIPTSSQEGVKAGAASFADGFPPLCFVPFASGGAGPFGADFNGALAQITAGLQWAQAGNYLPYSGTYSTIIGGYANGAIVQSAATPGLFWRSTADNNTSDPDTGGLNWVSWPRTGAISDNFYGTHGTYSLVVPAGALFADVDVWGAGGGGSGSNQGSSATIGASGAGGGCASSRGVAVTQGDTITVVVGQGGTPAASGGTAANGGSSTVFGAGVSAISATGGAGGAAGAGGGGSGSGGVVNLTGQGGTDLDGAIGSGGSCECAVGGNAAGGGGLGATINASNTIVPATVPGGGGGANYYVTDGTTGADGGVRITFFA